MKKIICVMICLVAFAACECRPCGSAKSSGWLDHKSTHGFSFKYPAGYRVDETSDPENAGVTNVFVVRVDDKGETVGPPVIQMNISKTQFTVTLWEGIPWEGYPSIIETFKFE